MTTHLSPNDVVPALRNNLIFSSTPQGLGDGLLSVTNITNGEELRLRGFETSLARMLDGHRTAREVVDAAGRLGLPLTLGGLEGFVKKLESFDLIDAQGAEAGQLSPWNPRQPWDEETRQRFRQALREGRSGHANEAALALDRLLDSAPQTPEAVTLKRRVTARPEAVENFPRVFAETERRWLAEASAEDAHAALPTWMSRRAVLTFWSVLALVTLLVLGATLIPVPHRVSAPAVLVPAASARIASPRTGTVATVQVSVGQHVEKHQVLFTYDVNPTVAALEQAVARVDKQRRQLDAFLKRGPTPQEAQQQLDKAQADVTRTQAQLDEARRASGDPFSGLVLPAQLAFNDALEELHKLQMALEERHPFHQLAALRRLESEVHQLELELVDSEVRAPEAGQVAFLAVRAGDVVIGGMDAARLDDSRRLKVLATVDPREAGGIEVGQQARVVSQGRRMMTTVTRVDGTAVELELENTGQAFAPGAARVQIEGKRRPWLRLR